MTLSPALRKLNVLAHVVLSVGWLGAVAAFLALSVAGLTSHDTRVVRAVYIAMNLIGLWMIVPLSLMALVSGLVASLGTHWGLFKHWWVLVKLVLTVGATAIVLMHQLTAVAEAARRAFDGLPPHCPTWAVWAYSSWDSALATTVLLGMTILGMYKPWGLTPWERPASARPEGTTLTGGMPHSLKVFLVVLSGLLALFAAIHLAGGGLGRHGR